MAPILQFIPGWPFQPRFLVMGAKRLYGWNLTMPVAEAFQSGLPRRAGSSELSSQIARPVGFVRPRKTRHRTPRRSRFLPPSTALSTSCRNSCPASPNFYKPDRSRDDLKDVLIRFLVSLDGYSATAMARNLRDLDAENGTDAADSPLQGLEDGGEPLTEQDRYLCALR
jgi:hypothetical protein